MFILCICCQAAAAYGRGEKCRAAELSEKVVSLVNLLFTILKSTYSCQLLQIAHDFSNSAHQAVPTEIPISFLFLILTYLGCDFLGKRIQTTSSRSE